MKSVLLSLMVLFSFNSAHATSAVGAYIYNCWMNGADSYWRWQDAGSGSWHDCSADAKFQSDDILDAVVTGEITADEAKVLLQKNKEKQSAEAKSSN